MSKKKDNNCNISCAKKTSIGGQALMEGIMMRGPQKSAMAVRNLEGEIIVEKWDTDSRFKGKIFKLPLVRGVFNFIDSMLVGYKCLMRSAEISGLEELEREAEEAKKAKKAEKAAKKAAKKGDAETVADQAPTTDGVASAVPSNDTNESEKATESKNEGKSSKEEKESSSLLTGAVMIIGTVLGILLAVGLFMLLPSYIYEGAVYLFPWLKVDNSSLNSLIKSAFEGILKIIILVGYMSLVSLMKEIRRTFMYHGAEHKTIFCYENGLPLTVENVRGQRRFHPRCGTSFLILMLIVSIFISFFIDPIFLFAIGKLPPTIVRVIVKILLLPIMMGVGYELIKVAGKHDNLFTRIISAPGMWLQHLTVLEPDDDMIECAITAFKEVIPPDENSSC